jgi:8-oxo-dGTP pyrophosphatase MutT (NUDIX family)
MGQRRARLSETMMTDEAFHSGLLEARVIRTTALCIFRHDRDAKRILVVEYYDPRRESRFYRPAGGQVEFGEYSADAVLREVEEELSIAVAPETLRSLGTIENIFTYEEQMGHEIVFVYEGQFSDSAAYRAASLPHNEGDAQGQAVWKRLDEFGPGAPLYPDGLLAMLQDGEK